MSFMYKTKKYQVASGLMAAAFSLTAFTGCGDTSAASESAAASSSVSAAPAADSSSAAETETASHTETLPVAEVQNGFSYVGADQDTPVSETIQGTVTAIEGETISMTIGGGMGETPPDMPLLMPMLLKPPPMGPVQTTPTAQQPRRAPPQLPKVTAWSMLQIPSPPVRIPPAASTPQAAVRSMHGIWP